MRFEGSVLVEIREKTAVPRWLDRVSPTPVVHAGEDGLDMESLSQIIDNWTDEFGRQWVEHFSNGEDWCNCPDGDLTLPVDRWDCKVTGEVCPIQAQIPLDNKEEFFSGCNVEKAAEELDKPPKEYKQGLWKAVQHGSYNGEHHKNSRYPCTFCRNDGVDEYLRFPWALTRISDHIEYEQARTDPEFVTDGLAYNLSNTICADCFLSLPDEHPELDFCTYGLEFENYVSVDYVIDC